MHSPAISLEGMADLAFLWNQFSAISFCHLENIETRKERQAKPKSKNRLNESVDILQGSTRKVFFSKLNILRIFRNLDYLVESGRALFHFVVILIRREGGIPSAGAV